MTGFEEFFHTYSACDIGRINFSDTNREYHLKSIETSDFYNQITLKTEQLSNYEVTCFGSVFNIEFP